MQESEVKLSKKLTDEISSKLKIEQSFEYFPSRFKFLSWHKGIRRGKFHVLLAGSGVGKTALFRSIIHDSAQNNKCLLWLTEESSAEYQTAFAKFKSPINLENLEIFHDNDIPSTLKTNKNLLKMYFNHIERTLATVSPEILFIDNLTTNDFYENSNPTEQSLFIQELIKLCRKNSVAIFALAHADSKFMNNRLLTGNDVRGCRQIYNKSEFFYLMQSFSVEGAKYTFIKPDKHRGYDATGAYYALSYSGGTYNYDTPIPFKDIASQFSNRERL